MGSIFSLIFGGVFGLFRKLYDLIVKYPLQAALVAAVLFIGYQSARINNLIDSRNLWEQRAGDEKANHQLTKANFQKTKDGYRLAVKKANADHAAFIAGIEKQWKDQANASENNYDRDLAAALDSMRRSIRAGRSGAGTQSFSVQASRPKTAPAPSDPSRSDTMPQLLATRSDDEDMYICTVNTVKALNFQSLYRSLQEIPASPDFPEAAE